MSTLAARAVVRCPLNQADRQLTRFFRDCTSVIGGFTRLPLRVYWPLSPHAGRAGVERVVIATIAERRAPAEMLPSYTVMWAAENGGPYPVFTGSLAIGAVEDYDSFELLLDGSYQPPLGVLGAGFDMLLGHHVAAQTGDTLLKTIARQMEETFVAEERTKISGAR